MLISIFTSCKNKWKFAKQGFMDCYLWDYSMKNEELRLEINFNVHISTTIWKWELCSYIKINYKLEFQIILWYSMLNVCIFSQGFEYGNFKAFSRFSTCITSLLSSNYIINYDQLWKNSLYISLFRIKSIDFYWW